MKYFKVTKIFMSMTNFEKHQGSEFWKSGPFSGLIGKPQLMISEESETFFGAISLIFSS